VSKRSRDFSRSKQSSVKLDRIREAMEILLHNSGTEERVALTEEIHKLKKEIDGVNAVRRKLAGTKTSLEDALEAIRSSNLWDDPAAEMVLQLTIDEIQAKIANLRPNDLLAKKAVQQRKLNFLETRWQVARDIMKRIEGKGNGCRS